MDAETRSDLATRYRTTLMIGVAMIASLFGYALIAELFKLTQTPFRGFAPFPGVEGMRYLFLGVALLDIFLIKFLRDRVLSGKIMAAGPPGPSTADVRLQNASILVYTLCEAIGVLGFVLFVIGGSSFDLYMFLALSLILFGVYFPRYGQWEEWARTMGRSSEGPDD